MIKTVKEIRNTLIIHVINKEAEQNHIYDLNN
jgi:hypothetical protein